MKERNRRVLYPVLAIGIGILLSWTQSLSVLAYPGTISTDNVNVRAQASTASDAVGRLNSGDTIEIEGEELDATNATWYKITLANGSAGYVRADLVTTDGAQTTGGNNNTGTDNSGTGTSTDAGTGTVTTLSDRSATVNTGTDTNVRSGAGRTFAQVATLTPGTEVTVTGETTASDGSKWYRVRYNGTQEGYILGDFLDVSEPEVPDEPEEPETPEEPVTPPVTVSPDADNTDGLMGKQYTVSYETDDTGEEVPWLIDNNSNAKYNVLSLIGDYEEVVRLQGVKRTNTILKVICVVLAIITIAAVALLILASARYRRMQEGGFEGASYGRGRRTSYDDEDDDDEDDEEDDDYDDEDDDEYEDEKPRRKGGFFSRFRKKRDYDDDDDEDDEDYDDEDEDDDDYEEEPRAIRRVYSPEPDYERSSGRGGTESPRRQSGRSRNFMEEDDDFDYNFLNEDD